MADITIKVVKEVPEAAKVSAGGRQPTPTQFDKSPLKVDTIYEIEVPSTKAEEDLIKEMRRWGDRQTPKVSISKVGMAPRTAMGNEKRTIYVRPYHPQPRATEANGTVNVQD